MDSTLQALWSSSGGSLTREELAITYGVSVCTIRDILVERTWRNVA